MEILYSLPDFVWNDDLNILIIKLFQETPHYFRDNVKIDSIYGSFPGCIWNGGRYIQGGINPIATHDLIKRYQDLGISLRFTFTNQYIEPKHFNDTYGNFILREGHNGHNGVNVYSEEFAEYIRINYPKYYLLNSTTKEITSLESINNYSKERLTVLPYTFNHDDNILANLKYPQNIELLCGEKCVDHCPQRKKHYEAISKITILADLDGFSFKCPFNCEGKSIYETMFKRQHLITPEQIETYYLPLGINKFKIAGRSEIKLNVLERYIYYLIKPEYQSELRNKILMELTQQL